MMLIFSPSRILRGTPNIFLRESYPPVSPALTCLPSAPSRVTQDNPLFHRKARLFSTQSFDDEGLGLFFPAPKNPMRMNPLLCSAPSLFDYISVLESPKKFGPRHTPPTHYPGCRRYLRFFCRPGPSGLVSPQGKSSDCDGFPSFM